MERGEDPSQAQGRKKEDGWGPGSGRRMEGRRAWWWWGGSDRLIGRTVGGGGWQSALRGSAPGGRGRRGGGPVGVAAVGPAQSPQCHFAINQGFSGQMKLQTIKSWSYVAQKFQIKYEIIGN
jgi:hypothetical protein